MTATEVMMRQEQAIKTASFIPEVWSQQILDTMKDEIFNSLLPVRSRGAQLLRDVALGHPEYGGEMGGPPAKPYTSMDDHTSDAGCYVSPTTANIMWTSNTTAADTTPTIATTAAGV